MNLKNNILKSWTQKLVSRPSILVAALAAMTIPVSAAPSLAANWYDHDDDRGRRYEHNDSHDRSHSDVHIDLNLGQRPPIYRERVMRVWVEPVYRTVTERVWVDPVYRTESDRVWVDEVTRDDCDRLWIPDRWQEREVVHGWGHGRYITRERVLVERGHYEDQPHRVVVVPGHWESTERRVLVCDGHWETVTRQEVVCPGHWEDRRVAVDDCGGPSPFGVIAGLTFHN